MGYTRSGYTPGVGYRDWNTHTEWGTHGVDTYTEWGTQGIGYIYRVRYTPTIYTYRVGYTWGGYTYGVGTHTRSGIDREGYRTSGIHTERDTYTVGRLNISPTCIIG